MNYTELSLTKVVELLKTKKVTSEELVRECLNKIKETKALNTLNSIFEEDAIKLAKEYDARREAGEELPVLAGVPITLKDNINLKGYETTCSSKFLKTYVSPYTATLAQKLLNAGAIVIGKNNMDEFAMGSSTEHSAFGVTLNPHDIERVPGGSSGGSAASVASFQCYASIGTDTGGSVRQPASLCGVVGLKPTYGTVSRYGVVAFASSLDQAGPITRTVKDNALIYSIIAGYDENETTSLKRPVPDYLNNLSKDIKGIKIGLVKEFFEHKMDSEVKEKFDYAVNWLKENGAEIIDISMPNINHALSCYYIISSAEAASNLARFDGVKYGVRGEGYTGLVDLYYKSRSQGFGKEVKRRIMLGNYVLSSGYYDAYYKKAKAVQSLIKKEFEEVFKRCDIVISPTSPTPAFKIGEKITDTLTMYLNDIYTVPVNIAELPAMSIPCGKSKGGLPIGLQLIGNKFSEQTLFNVGNYFEENAKGVN